MKKYINLAFFYACAAIACGVFYREFTKAYGFNGRTSLAFTHLHLFVLGTVMFLIIALFTDRLKLQDQKSFRTFLILYNIGLPFLVVMFFVRGIPQVTGAVLSVSASAAISGIAGISHTIITISLILLFQALRSCTA